MLAMLAILALLATMAMPAKESTAMSNSFSSFERVSVTAGDVKLHIRRGGTGAAVLLLHGFPETHLAWRTVAPRLAARFAVVAADLPGYGDSVGPEPDGQDERFSKRGMARSLVDGMSALDISRFAVIGHDHSLLLPFESGYTRIPD